MKLCQFDANGVCTVCRQPQSAPGFARNCVRRRVGLGDMVKKTLSFFGITEKRVSSAIGRPCGCSQRAEALNELGRKIGIG